MYSISVKVLHRLAAIAACAAPLSVCAQIANGIFVPMSGPMPNYWSGTNCRASGWAQVGFPIYMAELYLNEELVNWWVHTNPEVVPPMAMYL